MENLTDLPSMQILDKYSNTGIIVMGYTSDQMKSYAIQNIINVKSQVMKLEIELAKKYLEIENLKARLNQ